MATIAQEAPPLAAGMKLSREEFFRRWEMHPEITKAELLGGIVHMPSPVSPEHADSESDLGTWIGCYRIATAGTRSGHNATSLMFDDAPQADINLRIAPECGGRSWVEGKRLHGAPELITEICLTSADYDLNVKYDLYEAIGVQEYLAILTERKEIRWHHLVDGQYQILTPDADGVHRSRVFPGLWLDGQALLNGDMPKVLAVLQTGLASPEHQAFIEQLAKKRAT